MLNPLKILSKFIKSHNQKQLDKLRVILDKVNNFENEISKINDADFPKKTQELKEILAKDPNIDNILPEAFALVREASKRTREKDILMSRLWVVLYCTNLEFLK